jgi:hypothetical protein
MSNVTHGMSVEEVRNLARHLEQKGTEIEAMAREITAALDSAAWVGPDAEAFKDKWRSEGVARLTQAREILSAASQAATANAAAQEQTSEAGTGTFG